MSFLTNTFWGVRIFIWLFLIFAVIVFIGILLYYFRHKIKEKYIKWRFPERVIRVIIHFPNSQYFKEYWRLIPDKDSFSLEGKTYLYSNLAEIKENDDFAINSNGKIIVKVEDKEYNLDKNYKIKKKGEKYPEIHYIDGIPNPIDFINVLDTNIKFTSKDLEMFKENDLFEKLLTLKGEKGLIMFLMIIGIINLFISLFTVAKLMGWIQ